MFGFLKKITQKNRAEKAADAANVLNKDKAEQTAKTLPASLPDEIEQLQKNQTGVLKVQNDPAAGKAEQAYKPENAEKKYSFWKMSFEGLKKAVSYTAENLVNSTVSAVEEEAEFTDYVLDDMEELLIKADLGVSLASSITDKLRGQDKIKPSAVRQFLKSEFSDILKGAGSSDLNFNENGLSIYLITGVNGAGKTTLTAKLAYNFKQSGKKVLLAAADTFRAAAEEQLDIWAARAGAEIVRKDGIDSAAVVFDAVKKAQKENYDVLLIDTAGRLHNKRNLMDELNKIKSVIDKLAAGSLMESMLVLDANTGQNGLNQAKVFSETVNLTSAALTKMDGTAKGGIVFSIAKELKIPVKLIGTGEKLEDLKLFNPDDFIEALFQKK